MLSYLIRGPFDAEAFQQAVRLLVRRHPILRTTYHLKGYSEFQRAVRRADRESRSEIRGALRESGDVVRPLRQALIEYERVYFSTPERRARSAAQHGAIVDALAAGDQQGAAALVRDNFTTALPELTAELDARDPG